MHYKKPTLLINKQQCVNNILKMKTKAELHRLKFRPHFKTHQLLEVGSWFRRHGVGAITVSSVSMARYFAADGWEDITIAFPLNVLELSEINELAATHTINILLEHPDALLWIEKELDHELGVFIKIDTGYGRAGIPATDTAAVDALIKGITKNSLLVFKGLLVHSGDTYNAASTAGILEIHQHALAQLSMLKQRYLEQFPDLIISIGDTPSCSLANAFSGVDEIRPGNFIYYDIMQFHLGSCSLEDIAVCVACPVVAIHPKRNELIVYGGGVHLSKEALQLAGTKVYGYLALLHNDGWKPLPTANYVKSLSQEHGIVHLSDELIKQFQIGDVLGILPVHSCLSANLLRNSFSIQE